MDQRTPNNTHIYWLERRSGDAPRMLPLAGEARTEVVVVGGGVAGLSCAQTLAEKGRRVVLLEAGTCGGGASGRSSGFVTPDAEMELHDLDRNKGPAAAKRLWEFAAGGVDAIRENIVRHDIDCDMQVQDSLFVANSSRSAKVVQAEHDARARFGYPSTWYDGETVRSVLGSDTFHGGVRYPGTFGINAYRYCQSMRDILSRSGVVIHEGSPVHEIGEGWVRSNGHTVRADRVVLCLDRFLPDLGVLAGEVYHAQTFLAVSTPLADAEVAAIFPSSRLMVWDTDLIYQYFRVTGGQRLLLGAGSLRTTYDRRERVVAPGIFRKMKAWLARSFPQVPIEIEYFWPGLIGVSKDFLPIAALDSERKTLGLVSGAAGLPWAAALGRYMAEKIQSDRNDLDPEFDPSRRFPVGRFVQGWIGKPGAFAVSHGIVKYLR